MNEMCLMLVVYPIICFSPFVTDTTRKSEMGYFCCLIIASNLIINLSFMLKDTAANIIKMFKLRRFKAALKQKRIVTMTNRGKIRTIRRALVFTADDLHERISKKNATSKSLKDDLEYLQAHGAEDFNEMVEERRRGRNEARKEERRAVRRRRR